MCPQGFSITLSVAYQNKPGAGKAMGMSAVHACPTHPVETCPDCGFGLTRTQKGCGLENRVGNPDMVVLSCYTPPTPHLGTDMLNLSRSF